MKRILLAAVSAVVAIGVTSGAANAQRRITPFFGGGLATGTGDLGTDTKSGWVAFGGFDVPLGLDPGLTVGLTASYARVPYSGGFDEFTGVPALFGELGYVVGARSPRMIKPYLRAGAGVQLRRYDPGSTGYRAQSDGGLAFSAGGGLQFHFSPATLFVGAHYVADSDAGLLAFHGGLAFPAPAAK
jgi:opacity protein-like surface antigen